MYARRKGEHGSAILESFLSMILLGMILFGILQLFQLIVTDMVTEYAAFRGARSAAVGLKDEYAFREAEVKVAPVSGRRVRPTAGGDESVLRSYLAGEVDVEYSNWEGKRVFHTDYHCPNYGQPLTAVCSICNQRSSSHIEMSVWELGKTMKFRFDFVDYPLTIPLHEWLTGRETIDISAESELTNHSSVFLE